MEFDPITIISRPTIDTKRHLVGNNRRGWRLIKAVVFRTGSPDNRSIIYEATADQTLTGVLVDNNEKLVRIILLKNGDYSTATFQQKGRRTIVGLILESDTKTYTPKIWF